MAVSAVKDHASQKRRNAIMRFMIYFFLIVITAFMLLPFLWMLSSSFKENKDVFGFPIQWIPANPRWQNYVDIWTEIPLLTFIKNTAKITIVVTLLQLFTSSFAAYAFAKMQFKGKNVLFLGYIATIAVPWQAYMVPQFMMMSSWGLNNTHLAIMCLQAFSAFGVFLMKQFYEGVPSELCEAARIDGLTEYGIWWHIMLPLSLPALSTLTIFTFVNTWNDFLGPLIYLTRTELKTIQIGLRMFISQYSAEYGLIMTRYLRVCPSRNTSSRASLPAASRAEIRPRGTLSLPIARPKRADIPTSTGAGPGAFAPAPPSFVCKEALYAHLPKPRPHRLRGPAGPGRRLPPGGDQPSPVHLAVPEPLQRGRRLPRLPQQPVDLRLLARGDLAGL